MRLTARNVWRSCSSVSPSRAEVAAVVAARRPDEGRAPPEAASASCPAGSRPGATCASTALLPGADPADSPGRSRSSPPTGPSRHVLARRRHPGSPQRGTWACYRPIGEISGLGAIQGFPAHVLLKGWLKAGGMNGKGFTDTERGTPQGGLVSPRLANVALHGMEAAIGVCYQKDKTGNATIRSKRALVSDADDGVILTETERDAILATHPLASGLPDSWNSQKRNPVSDS